MVNVLTFGPVGAQEVLLEVKFAEVDRAAMTQLGVNLFSTGAGNTTGTVTTHQFGGCRASERPPIPARSARFQPALPWISDALNLFFFNPAMHFGAVVKALETSNLLQILAEPNLIAVNGKEANFLAGGEFPFPVVQPGSGFPRSPFSSKISGCNWRLLR